MTKPKAIIIELEGCLADHRHRLHFVDPSGIINYLKGEKGKWVNVFTKEPFIPNYRLFYDAMDKDGVNEGVQEIVNTFNSHYGTHATIIFVTGRPEKYRDETIHWLEVAVNLHDGGINFLKPEWKLFMRPDYDPNRVLLSMPPQKCPDTRPAAEVKREIYEREIMGKYDALFVLEDDNACIEMYRSLGLTCLKVLLPN